MWFRKRPDSDFQTEIESHIRLEIDRLIAEGIPPAEAQAAARRGFGNVGSSGRRSINRNAGCGGISCIRICAMACGLSARHLLFWLPPP